MKIIITNNRAAFVYAKKIKPLSINIVYNEILSKFYSSLCLIRIL